MSVHVRCPHCRTPCVVAEQYLGAPVKCGRCGRSFTTRTTGIAAPPMRLDIAAASTPHLRAQAEQRCLTQHLVYWNLDERHELAVLLISGSARQAAAALAPLVAGFLNGASQDVAAAAERLAAVCTAPTTICVLWDGQALIGGVREVSLYQQSTRRLTRLRRGSMKLSVGDWLILAGAGSQPREDKVLAAPSALALAEQLVQNGSDTVVVVRCY